LGIFYREEKDYKQALRVFKVVWRKDFKLLYFKHYLLMVGNGFLYKILMNFKYSK